MLGSVESLILFLVSIYGVENYGIDNTGGIADIWYISIVVYTSMIMVVTTKLLINTNYWTYLSFLFPGITTYLCFLIFLLISETANFTSSATVSFASITSRFWLIIFFNVVVCLIIDMTIKEFDFFFRPNLSQQMMMYSNAVGYGNVNDEKDLPENVKELLNNYTMYEKIPNQPPKYTNSRIDEDSSTAKLQAVKLNFQDSSINNGLNIKFDKKVDINNYH